MEDELDKFFRTRTVYHVADMFLSARSGRVNIFLGKSIDVGDNLYDAVFISPFNEIDAHTRVLFARTAQEGDAEILFLASRPGAVRAGPDTDAAADAFFDVADRAEVLHLQGFYRKLFALADAHAAADAAAGVELGFRHAHDAKVVHADFVAVVRTAGQGYFDVQVIRENSLFNPFSQGRRIVVAEGADAVADAGHDISCARSFKTSAFFALIDVEFINDRLQGLFYFFYFFKGNPHDFKALTDGQMDFAIAICFCNMLDLAQDLGIQGPTGYTDTGGSHIAIFRYSESVFF